MTYLQSHWGLALAVLYVLSLTLIPWVLLKKTLHSSSAVAWIMSIVFIPILGPLLCLVFGMNRVERHRLKKRRAQRHIAERVSARVRDRGGREEEMEPLQRQLYEFAAKLDGDMPALQNDVCLIPETKDAFERIEAAILGAQRWVHIEFYIWRSDKIGTRLRDLMIKKAKQGLEVRFLYDGVGSISLGRPFLWPMRKTGIQVAPFLPGHRFWERWSINLRNHRKIVLVDGTFGFTGGMNVGDEYLGRNPAYGYWRDTQLLLRGPAVTQLQQVFAEDWYYATGEELTNPELYPDVPEQGTVTTQIIAGGPSGEIEPFHSLMYLAINEARESVTLATSYFVPPESLSMALETAARRGVRVRLLVAGKATYFWTLMAGRSYYTALLNAGVEIYEYQKGLFHAKTITVDGQWSFVGTPNFDMRSFTINFEVGAALYDRGMAKLLEEHFEADLMHSQPISLSDWRKRPTRKVLSEQFCRLFAPVL